MRLLCTLLLCGLSSGIAAAQAVSLPVLVADVAGGPIEFATVEVVGTGTGAVTDADGVATVVLPKGYPAQLSISSVGLATLDTVLTAAPKGALSLKSSRLDLADVVVTGTLSPVLRTESPVPVEVYTREFLLADPTPSLFGAMQNVNGVRPQLNCSVCNTGDIHVNGLEGPYTMVTIDGLPIVSGLGTVYGLLGIPNSMIERVEVVKGPAGSLYGSEAVGGLINVITREVGRAPKLTADAFTTAWGDVTADLGVSARLGEHVGLLTSANAYYFDHVVDQNGDNFTDQTLAQRLSVFQKLKVDGGRAHGLSLAWRALAERRWGGELDFDPELDRGGTERYGEAIDTRRVELMGRYEVAGVRGLALTASGNVHEQRSDYGATNYDAVQAIGFTQATLSRKLARHNLLFGAAGRYTYYDDDTGATVDETGANRVDEVFLPGAFVQDEWVRGRTRVLAGMRLDHDPRHGAIWTPRVGVKVPAGEGANLRVNLGTGFRVVNLFTEEHAALSGAREVVVAEALAPERSVSLNANLDKRWALPSGDLFTVEGSTWYTRFSNQIIPDYETDAQEIRYDNLDGYSVSRGASAEARYTGPRLTARAGVTFTDVSVVEDGVSARPLLNERWSGVWSVDYALPQVGRRGDAWRLNYTASLYGPMGLPVLGPLDPRPAESPWFSLQNIQATWAPAGSRWEFYGGIKNLLDFTPAANSIARAFDPFDGGVTFDAAGDSVATADNPGALVFDPSYVYAANVGRRGFLGVRFTAE